MSQKETPMKTAQKKPEQVKPNEAQRKASQQKQRKRKLTEWLISLGVTLVILGVVVGAQYWFSSFTQIGLNMMIVWIGNAIGGLLMLLIVHHFVKAPKNDDFRP